MEPQMWQNPFVNIFKNVRIGHDNNDNKKIKKEGEVKYTLDETVRFCARFTNHDGMHLYYQVTSSHSFPRAAGGSPVCCWPSQCR